MKTLKGMKTLTPQAEQLKQNVVKISRGFFFLRFCTFYLNLFGCAITARNTGSTVKIAEKFASKFS